MAGTFWVWFCVIWPVAISLLNSAGKRKVSSKSEPMEDDAFVGGTYINSKWWRAPTSTNDGALCDAALIENNHANTHTACTKECIALSKRSAIIFLIYGEFIDSSKIVSRQCSGFLRGTCRSQFLGLFSVCWCEGKDFSRVSFFCRTFILNVLRWLLNYKTRTGIFYENYIKPYTEMLKSDPELSISDNARLKATVFWKMVVQPKLPAFAGGGVDIGGGNRNMTMDELDKMLYDQIRQEFEQAGEDVDDDDEEEEEEEYLEPWEEQDTYKQPQKQQQNRQQQKQMQ